MATKTPMPYRIDLGEFMNTIWVLYMLRRAIYYNLYYNTRYLW